MSIETSPLAGLIYDFDLSQEIYLSKGEVYENNKGTLNDGEWKRQAYDFAFLSKELTAHKEGRKVGTAILQGELSGPQRLAATMLKNYFIGVDLDDGMPTEELLDTVRAAGVYAIWYTTHSHLKNETEVTEAKWNEWAKANPGKDASAYLIEEKGFRAEIAEGATRSDLVPIATGPGYRITHNPIPKHRLVMPLAQPWDFYNRIDFASSEDALAAWKAAYSLLMGKLGLPFDTACQDAARAYFLPRHKAGAPFDSGVVPGKAIDLLGLWQANGCPRDYGKQQKAKGEALDPAQAATMRKLAQWAAQGFADRFQLSAALEANGYEDFRAEYDKADKRHIGCPFCEGHTKQVRDGSTFFIDAGLSRSGGLVIECMHGSCSHRDRLEMLRGMLSEGWITWDDLRSPDYLIEVEEETGPAIKSDEYDVKLLNPYLFQEGDVGRIIDAPENAKGFDDWVKAVNKRFALVVQGNDTKYIWQKKNGSLAVMDASSVRDLLAPYGHSWVTVTENAKGEIKEKVNFRSAFDIWRGSTDRRFCDSVIFEPGCTDPDAFNLFRGWNVIPKQGDWTLLRDHIYKVICDGNPDHFNWLMDYMAQMIQFPGDKPGTAVVLQGSKGTGKSTMAEYLASLVDPYMTIVDQKDHIFGKFNKHQQANVLMVAEEVFWTGNKEHENKLKNLITAREMLIEGKGVDALKVKSFCRLIMISNEEWVVPSTEDERRYFCLSPSDRYLPKQANERKAYFDALHKQMQKEGGREAMMFELMTRKITSNLRQAPKTDGGKLQIFRTLQPTVKWWIEAVVSGAVLFGTGKTFKDWEDSPLVLNSSQIETLHRNFENDLESTKAPTAKAWFGRARTEALGELAKVDRVGAAKKEQLTLAPYSQITANLTERFGSASINQFLN